MVMVTLEPSIAQSTCENALRSLMGYVFLQKYDADWIERVSTEQQRELWAERAKAEQKTRERRGVAETDGPGLTYANMYDLVKIAKTYWSDLEPALGDAYPLLVRMEKLRNTTAHSRPLVTFEQELLSGIAGQIRNQVTLYMSTRDPAGEIYPRIESAVDCFGHRLTGWDGPIGEIFEGKVTGAILRPGDRVQVTVTGTDGRDRPLEWELITPAGTHAASAISASGTEAQLEWEVTDADVGEAAVINIQMRAKGAKYQRANGFDHRAYFQYIVRPPVGHDLK
ncbi:hypothetical protein CH278_23900 [Rhodococcus sp. 05-2254-5]|nr:hypothetical protein CH278_23900 [Rhodococcus sp. 05-2254-5]OZE38179.1 hypothetical protein CH256_07745 [Rhodococcus sp. 05-2254-6]OZE57039.1 hypothetical protein CH269_13760 [Rhodococcus sp. 05-2254-1]OZE72336.1 hypothetical protein CH305_28395 [Rhodococcus sp. 15-649-2-2]